MRRRSSSSVRPYDAHDMNEKINIPVITPLQKLNRSTKNNILLSQNTLPSSFTIKSKKTSTSDKMSGSLLQVAGVGAHDSFITVKPEITFWRGGYQRHTRFAVEPIRVDFTGTANYGNTVTALIPMNGDMLGRMWVVATFNALTPVAGPVHVTNAFGHALIDEVRITIGGNEIDRHYGDYLNCLEELSAEPGKELGETIFKSASAPQLVAWSTTNHTLFIPLEFWFCRFYEQALPLIALQNNEIRLRIAFLAQANLFQLLAGGAAALTTNYTGATLTDVYLLCTYTFLDAFERRYLARNTHQYLINTLQYTSATQLTGATSYTVQLQWNHPIKALIFVIQDVTHRTNNDRFNYEGLAPGDDPLVSARIQLNSQDRVTDLPAIFYRDVEPRRVAHRLPDKHIYMYSFALDPFSCKPTGHVNFSRIDRATVILTTQAITAGEIRVYGLAANILKIQNGMGNVRFAS